MDPSKAAANLRKHGVSFNEASTVFGDDLSTTASDPDHAVSEHRYIIIGLSKVSGLSNRRRLVMVSHSERAGRIRIISARILTPIERRTYEKIG